MNETATSIRQVMNSMKSDSIYKTLKFRYFSNGSQRAGLYAGWELEFRPGLLLIGIMLMKLRINDRRCLFSPELMTGFAIC